MKKMKRFCSLLLAGVMTLAMTVPALAATVTPRDATIDTTDLTKYAVKKHLVVDKDAPIPKADFEFSLTPASVVEGTEVDKVPVFEGIALTNNGTTISFSNASSTTAGDTTSGIADSSEKYATGESKIDLTGSSSYTKPGIYRYILKEEIPIAGIAGMTYDKSEYHVDVYVGYDTTAGNGSSLVVLFVKTTQIKSAAGIEMEVSTKKDPEFVNKYETNALEISKTVTGNMGDRDKGFVFTLNVVANDQLAVETKLTAVKTMQVGTSGVEVKVGTSCNFELKHGEKLTVYGLPIGTEYTVTEADYSGEGYTTSYITSEGGRAGQKQDGSAVQNAIVEGGNIEAFTNDKNITTPTGLFLEFAPYIVIVLLAGAAAVVMFTRKRRKLAR